MFDYRCKECGVVKEYFTSPSVPKALRPPEDGKCEECGGELEQLFSPQGQSFDIIGSCYMNDYGKHAWKKNLTPTQQAKVLCGEMDPY